MVDIVKEEVARRHMISGVTTSLEIELDPSQQLPPRDTSEQIIIKEYEREQYPSGPLNSAADGLDE